MTFTKTMHASFSLALAGGLALAGCGDSGPTDGGGTDAGVDMTTPGEGGVDMGVAATCPDTAPGPANQMGGCCWRASNATRLTMPTFRLAALKLTAPSGTLSGAVVGGLLQQGFDAETFNWIIDLSGAPTTGVGDGMIKTGYGERNDADGTFAFVNGIAPAPGDVNRWNPVMEAAHFDGETVTTAPYPGVITIPSFDAMMPSHPLLVEFPIYNLQLLSMPMTESRSCVGSRGTRWLTASGGRISAYIRVSDAKDRMIVYPPINTSLCGVIAGNLADTTYCDGAQSGWTTKPDSLCTGTTCTANTTGMMDVCDPATPEGMTGAGGKPGCSAWHLLGEFVAQGVTAH